MSEYEAPTNYVSYGELVFIRRCPVCSRFVKPDADIHVMENGLGELKWDKPNATCKVHGRVEMKFEGCF